MTVPKTFAGSITALLTPFREGRVDEAALQSFVDWQITQGSHGLVPCGTTGESSTLSHDEHKRVVELTLEIARGRVPVIAGTGSNSTSEALELARHAEKSGADAILVVAPYYNKPTQAGLYEHYLAIDRAVSLPIIVYNIPARSVVDISVETLGRIFEDCKNVIGVKDATANLLRPSLERMRCGQDFNLLSGEDGTALGYMAHGGHGCISVTSNIAPKLCSRFQEACLAGNFHEALEIQDRLMPLHQAIFLEGNPAGPKYAASRLKLMEYELRLPLVPISPGVAEQIDKALETAGLL